jgi:hypothetical protein
MFPLVPFESGADVEYQVPTSSQRDQEDDVIVIDSVDEDEDGIADEGVSELLFDSLIWISVCHLLLWELEFITL